MKKTNKKIMPLLLADFYKMTHTLQYSKDITKVVSYYTSRGSRIKSWDKSIMFGLQAFIQDYFIDYFSDNFFSRPKDEVVNEYNRILKHTLGENNYEVSNIEKLHDLGYLPIEIKAIKEGERVNLKVPMFEVSNTHDEFSWLTNALETLISCNIWHPILSANVGYEYRKIVNKYYDISCDNYVPRNKAIGDFGMRGSESLESAVRTGGAFLLSFLLSATVPSICWLEDNYNCDIEEDEVGFGSPSTEHSVMCSSFAIDGDEITMIKRLLTEVYPNQNFSMVSDSYDYWNLVETILPQCKDEIMAHNGTILIRGDSGNPIDVVTTTVFKLWEQFGGTVNSKGYKVLDTHVKAIYGDSITPKRAKAIYEILIENGFACNNVALGVGSFSFQCWQNEDDSFSPFTRDTFNSCIKATYCETSDGKEIPIFKDPKDGGFKKSQKGCCVVYKDSNGEFSYKDEKSFKETQVNENELKTVFKNGKMVKTYSLNDIRETLHKGEF